MATPVCMKRMQKERAKFAEQNNDDYFVNITDDDLLNFNAYVLGPADTLYAYKLIKLQFTIPSNYPLVPPKVKFIQHSGGRLHPNLYVEGKVCLSILGTWPGEPWATAMTVESVLITLRSLLDNEPYKHEPGGRDHPDLNKYVRFVSWKSLLLDYLKHEQDPAAKDFLQRHVAANGSSMVAEIEKQQKAGIQGDTLKNPYGGASVIQDYKKLIADVKAVVASASAQESSSSASPLKRKPDDMSGNSETNVASDATQAAEASPAKRIKEVIDLT